MYNLKDSARLCAKNNKPTLKGVGLFPSNFSHPFPQIPKTGTKIDTRRTGRKVGWGTA
jgi:hypothetical protein